MYGVTTTWAALRSSSMPAFPSSTDITSSWIPLASFQVIRRCHSFSTIITLSLLPQSLLVRRCRCLFIIVVARSSSPPPLFPHHHLFSMDFTSPLLPLAPFVLNGHRIAFSTTGIVRSFVHSSFICRRCHCRLCHSTFSYYTVVGTSSLPLLILVVLSLNCLLPLLLSPLSPSLL